MESRASSCSSFVIVDDEVVSVHSSCNSDFHPASDDNDMRDEAGAIALVPEPIEQPLLLRNTTYPYLSAVLRGLDSRPVFPATKVRFAPHHTVTRVHSPFPPTTTVRDAPPAAAQDPDNFQDRLCSVRHEHCYRGHTVRRCICECQGKVTKDVISRVISGDSKDVVKGLLTKVPITQLDHDINWVSNKVASGTPWSLENVSIKKVGGGSRDIIPDLLSSATAVNVIHKNRTGVSTEIEFVMPVIGHVVTKVSKDSSDQSATIDPEDLYTLANGKPKRLGCLRLSLRDPLPKGTRVLPAHLTSTVPTCTKTYVGKALISNTSVHNCWVPKHMNPRAMLQIDLKRNYFVHTLTVMARRPDVYRYPTRDQILDLGYEASGTGAYKGPYYTMLTNKAALECVEKFEIFCRVDDGKDWISLGTFCGNHSYVDLAQHDLTKFAFDIPASDRCRGIRVRYLRLRPLSRAEGGGTRPWAMRVQVYGSEANVVTSPVPASNDSDKLHRGSLNRDTATAGDEENAETVKYSVKICHHGEASRYSGVQCFGRGRNGEKGLVKLAGFERKGLIADALPHNF